MNGKGQDFIYSERIEIGIEIKVFYSDYCGQRESFVFNACVLYEQNELVLYVNAEELASIAKEKLQKAFVTPIKRKNIKITKAWIGHCDIILSILDEGIRFTRRISQYNREIFSMSLKRIKFSFKEKTDKYVYRLSSICSPKLYSPLEFLVNASNRVVGIREAPLKDRCFGLPFSLSKAYKYAYIETNNIDILLTCFSFYYSTRFEYDIVSYPENDEGTCIEITVPQYKVLPNNICLSFGYLLSNQQSLGNFMNFIELTNQANVNLNEGKQLKCYIDGHVRAEYLDNISKLIIYTTILEKMAGVRVNDDTHKCIKNYLAKEKININKIDKSIAKQRIRNENNDTISNFVGLRNFFVHHLGSEKAEFFLQKSDMLFYLKLCVVILLLKRMGYSNLSFKPEFMHLSLFDECLRVGELEQVKARGCRIWKFIRNLIHNKN